MGKKLSGCIMNKSVVGFPGAGSYDPVPVFHSDGLTKFGSDRRKGIFDEKKARFGPGPFQY